MASRSTASYFRSILKAGKYQRRLHLGYRWQYIALDRRHDAERAPMWLLYLGSSHSAKIWVQASRALAAPAEVRKSEGGEIVIFEKRCASIKTRRGVDR